MLDAFRCPAVSAQTGKDANPRLSGADAEVAQNVTGSVSVRIVVIAIPPATIGAFIAHAETSPISISIAVLKILNGPHPVAVSVTSLLQSSHVDIPWIVLSPFVLTFAVPVSISVLESVLMGLLHTATVVVVVIVAILSIRQSR